MVNALNRTSIAGLLANNLNLTDTTLEVDYDRVVIAEDGSNLRFIDVELVLNNETRIMIGNLTVSSDDLADLLPDETEDYKGTIPNDHTILHNASSWHGLFFFHGHLREAAYQKYCSPSDVSSSVYAVYAARNMSKAVPAVCTRVLKHLTRPPRSTTLTAPDIHRQRCQGLAVPRRQLPAASHLAASPRDQDDSKRVREPLSAHPAMLRTRLVRHVRGERARDQV